MIKIYYTDVSVLEFDEKKFKNKISKLRYEKIKTLKKEKDKLLSLGAELLLNYAVQQYFPGVVEPVKYYYNKNGKPFIEGNPVYFSLSHSGNYSACAISDNEIGIDIELMRDINLNIAKKFFTQKEYEYIISKPEKRIEHFFDIWVLKESYMKATGYGLSLGLRNFSFIIDDSGKIDVFLDKGEKQIFNFLKFLIDDKYKLAICSKSFEKKSKIKLNKIVF